MSMMKKLQTFPLILGWPRYNMAHRWLSLLMGVALIQGFLSLSPIPVPDEEWEEFSRMMRDPAYRLPTTTRPSHYELTIEPYFDNPPTDVTPFTFDGQVVIYLSPTEENVREIVIHANDLTISSLTVEYELDGITHQIVDPATIFTIEDPYSFLRIPVTEDLILNRVYTARIAFRGNIQSGMRGFYRSWYNDNTGRKWMGTTQFQPIHARSAFPCYDEPGFKATFDITIIRQASLSPSLSNMPIRETNSLPNDRISETFYTTPVTSTYLLAFIVSDYEVAAGNNDQSRPFHIYARNNVGDTGQWAQDVGEELLVAMEELTQIPYYTMAPNIDMKQAAIPDFSAGAMENWGLLTYREALILYDPVHSNHFYRQRVANIVSHEIVHMWFGNLVTCAWWDNLWLNEGFARYYQYFLTGAVRPEMDYETRFITEQLHQAMLSDSVDSAHALTDPSVNDPDAVSAHFSTITYAKGASILRMTQHLLGLETHVKGLRRYLAERQFDVAEPHHLFSALDAAATEDEALTRNEYNGITVDSYFRTWSEQAGHPLLTVTINQQTGQMIVVQARWERDTGVSSVPSLWQIPITWTRRGAIDFDDLKPSQVMTAQVTTISRGSTELDWVIFNKQQSGFYRVNYDHNNWALITQALRGSDRLLIHQYNRAQIVDDVFLFARASLMPYNRAFNILSFLQSEESYAPWMAAITGFNFALRRLAHDEENLQELRDEIIKLSGNVTARLGFAEINGEPYMDGSLRMYLNQFLCNVGHPDCVAAAGTNFQNWINGAFVPANMRPWVYCEGLRQASESDFDIFWARYLEEDLANEKLVMLQNAGCTGEEASLRKFLDAIVAGDDAVRPQDFSAALLSAVSGNEFNTMRMFEWLKENVVQATTTLGNLNTIINNIAGRLLNEDQIDQFQTWLEDNREQIGSSYNVGINGIATARRNLEWSENRLTEFVEYFKTGYVEDVLELEENESEEGDDEESEEEEEEEEDDDSSSSIAAISVVTLLVTVAINILA